MVTIDDIDKDIEKRIYTPAQPSAASTAPSVSRIQDDGLGQLRGAIGLMRELDAWRGDMQRAELEKMKAIEQVINSRVDTAIKSLESTGRDPMDEIFVEGGKEFISMLKQARTSGMWNTPPNANRTNSSPPPAQGTTTQTQAQNAPPTPQEEVANMKLSPERAQYYADMIFENFPDKVLAAQRGEISKEDALKNIMASGCNKENAELIYTELMNTDYSGGESPSTIPNEYSTTQGTTTPGRDEK